MAHHSAWKHFRGLSKTRVFPSKPVRRRSACGGPFQLHTRQPRRCRRSSKECRGLHTNRYDCHWSTHKTCVRRDKPLGSRDEAIRTVSNGTWRSGGRLGRSGNARSPRRERRTVDGQRGTRQAWTRRVWWTDGFRCRERANSETTRAVEFVSQAVGTISKALSGPRAKEDANPEPRQ